MEFCPKALEEGRLYQTSNRDVGQALPLSCLFLTGLQHCAGREVLASLCLTVEKPHSQWRSLQIDGMLKSRGKPHYGEDVTSPNCPRLLPFSLCPWRQRSTSTSISTSTALQPCRCFPFSLHIHCSPVTQMFSFWAHRRAWLGLGVCDLWPFE